jgi:hypothetical protein
MILAPLYWVACFSSAIPLLQESPMPNLPKKAALSGKMPKAMAALKTAAKAPAKAAKTRVMPDMAPATALKGSGLGKDRSTKVMKSRAKADLSPAPSARARKLDKVTF